MSRRFIPLVVALLAVPSSLAAASPAPVPSPRASSAPVSSEEAAEWTYAGEGGPEAWAAIDETYALCASDTGQSPIDIPLSALPSRDLPTIEAAYVDGVASVVDVGHTVQVQAGVGKALRIDGVEHPLLQMHFHVPAEHTVEGVVAAAEVHLVHGSPDGSLLVLGLFLEAADVPDPAWGAAVEAFGAVGSDRAARTFARIPWSTLLSGGLRGTVRYTGSLTTPPCTDGVDWIVATVPVPVPAEVIDGLAALYSGNARPVQPVGDREIVRDGDGG